jgi:protoporphyrinogen oxidase
VSFTRREILATFLGVAFAQQACRKKSPFIPPGEIVGASAARGHRLRERIDIDVPRERMRKRKVVIVGAGIAGLSAAWHLQRQGETDVEILELEAQVGGTAKNGLTALTPHPWGAHYINAPLAEHRAMVQLLTEMEVLEPGSKDAVVAEEFLCREPEERVFYRGRWYEGLYLRAGASADDLAQLERFERVVATWVDTRDGDGRRAFAIPMESGSEDERMRALDRLSMAEWMQKNAFTSQRLLWLVDYACRDDYGARPHATSAWAGLFYFAARKRNGADESQPVVTWPEGNGRLVRHLSKRMKNNTSTGVLVARLIPTEHGISVLGLDAEDKAFGVLADRVIFAAPHHVAGRIIEGYAPSPEFQYGAWLVSNLSLHARPASRGFPLAWDNVFYDSPSLGYVVATHQRGSDFGPTVLTHYLPLTDGGAHEERQRLFALDHAAAADLVLSDIERAHPDIRTLTDRIDVMRWGHAMIRPAPGFIFGEARRKAREPFRGVHFAHSDLSGIPLFEEAFYRGLRAADAVRGA